jgi:hypothetical protein
MPLNRRLFATLSSVLFLQFSLLGSGTVCERGHASGDRVMDGAGSAMPAMVRDSDSTAAVSEAMYQPVNASDARQRDAHGTSDSCRGTPAPGTCAFMSSCAWSQSAAVEPLTAAVGSRTSSNLLEPETLRTGPAVAPELPPPRA